MGIGNRANGSAHAPTRLQEEPRAPRAPCYRISHGQTAVKASAAIPGWSSPSAKERLGDPANDVWARGFLSGRRGPPNNGKPTSGTRMQDLASISGQGWRGRSSLVRALTNRDPPAIAG